MTTKKSSKHGANQMTRPAWQMSKLAFLTIAMASALQGSGAQAQEATTFASAFNVPVFDQIDANGVDLVGGVWRVQTPMITFGEGSERVSRGLQWTGQAWTHTGHPSMWKKDNKYIIMYKGASHEFNGFGSGFSKRAPIDGSSLSCNTLSAGSGISSCLFKSREGDQVAFNGFYSALSNFGDKMGFSSLQFGNVGIQQILISETDDGNPPFSTISGGFYSTGGSGFSRWGYHATLYGTQVWDYDYNRVSKIIPIQGKTLSISTPNNDASDEHYLLPRNTTQTVTDHLGYAWTYLINNDRDLVSVSSPGGAATITATYYGDHRVKTISTPAGVWNYSYSLPLGDIRSTTVTNPQGEQTVVKYHNDDGYVTEVRDALNRTTTYTWSSSTKRLDRVTYPEGNYVAFEYDGRGNVTKKTEVAKGGGGSLVWRAGYPATCPNGGNCNQPTWIIDPKNNQTDFEYTGNSPGPTKVIYPAADAQSPRKTEWNEYTNGRLTRTKTCMTQTSCAGTADEIVKEISYTGRGISSPSLATASNIASFVVTVPATEKVTASGQSLLTCHYYDANGRRVMTTPPNSGLSSCPTATILTAAPSVNPPSPGYPRSQPTFPGVAAGGGGGTGGGGGGGGEDPPEDPCVVNQTLCQ